MGVFVFTCSHHQTGLGDCLQIRQRVRLGALVFTTYHKSLRLATVNLLSGLFGAAMNPDISSILNNDSRQWLSLAPRSTSVLDWNRNRTGPFQNTELSLSTRTSEQWI